MLCPIPVCKATIVEYVSNDVTPDNLVAVFRPRAANGPLAEVSIAHSLVHREYPRVPRRGVTLHVVSRHLRGQIGGP